MPVSQHVAFVINMWTQLAKVYPWPWLLRCITASEEEPMRYIESSKAETDKSLSKSSKLNILNHILLSTWRDWFFSPFMWNPEMLLSEVFHAPFIDTEISTKFSRSSLWRTIICPSAYMSSSTHKNWDPCCFTYQQTVNEVSLNVIQVSLYSLFLNVYLCSCVCLRTLVPWEQGLIVLIASAKVYM